MWRHLISPQAPVQRNAVHLDDGSSGREDSPAGSGWSGTEFVLLRSQGWRMNSQNWTQGHGAREPTTQLHRMVPRQLSRAAEAA